MPEPNADRGTCGNLARRHALVGVSARYVVKVLVVVGVILTCCSPILWPLLTTRVGQDVPLTGPNEANRVEHPSGFSIVAPPNWTGRAVGGDPDFPPSIYLYPQSAFPRRYSATLGVMRYLGKPERDLEGAKDTVFQGQPAFEHISMAPYRGFESPAHFGYKLIFPRGDKWYAIQFGICVELGDVPAVFREYFDSFRTTQGHETALR